MIGMIVRSDAEIPRQVLGGIDDAARHALGFLDPLMKRAKAQIAENESCGCMSQRPARTCSALSHGRNRTRRASHA
jgi:hypothetical protein